MKGLPCADSAAWRCFSPVVAAAAAAAAAAAVVVAAAAGQSLCFCSRPLAASAPQLPVLRQRSPRQSSPYGSYALSLQQIATAPGTCKVPCTPQKVE